MGKLTRIEAHAKHIINNITKTDHVISCWATDIELRQIRGAAQRARGAAVSDCVDASDRCERLRQRLRNNRHTAITKDLCEDIQKVESACRRVAQNCEIFHECVERLSARSRVDTHEARSYVETKSQMDIAWESDAMLRQARKLLEKAEEMAESHGVDANVEESVASSDSEDSIDSEET